MTLDEVFHAACRVCGFGSQPIHGRKFSVVYPYPILDKRSTTIIYDADEQTVSVVRYQIIDLKALRALGFIRQKAGSSKFNKMMVYKHKR